MDIQLINNPLLNELHREAQKNVRLRQHDDLRTTTQDSSQRMINALEVRTKIPIHRHMDATETVVFIEGCFDEVFYEELPNVDAGGPVRNGETALDESVFKEVARVRICPREGIFGLQVPKTAWHTIL